jgi:hypothetical protein
VYAGADALLAALGALAHVSRAFQEAAQKHVKRANAHAED